MALVAHRAGGIVAPVAAICHHKVVAQCINHQPHNSIVGSSGARVGRRRRALGQVHPREQEATREQSQRRQVQHQQHGGPRPWLAQQAHELAEH